MSMGGPTKAARAAAAAVIALPLLSACQTTGSNQQAGQLGGAAVGGILGGIAGGAIGGNRTGAVIGALAGAAAGYFLGGAIAEALSNPADRQKASAATQQVLDAPAPPPAPAPRASPRPRPQQTQPVQATWRSDSSQNISGSSTLQSVSRTQDGGECRLVREVAYVQGREVQQETRYCRSPNGGWAQA